jgi:predicted RNase H-like nuclease (RuvC/YqgF family)
MSVPESNQHEFDERELREAIATLETSLEALKERYHQVKRDRAKKEQLQQRQEELKQQQRDNPAREPIKTELHYLEQELEELEVRLESQLFTLSTLKEPFWQAVRFGGIGVIIGWMLKACAS